jgi:hypothetical protein
MKKYLYPLKEDSVYFIDSSEALSQKYTTVKVAPGTFALEKPYVAVQHTDDHLESPLTGSDQGEKSDLGRPKKRRKNSEAVSNISDALQKQHDEIKDLLMESLEKVKDLLKTRDSPSQSDESTEAVDLIAWAGLASLVQRSQRNTTSVDITELDLQDHSVIYNSMIHSAEERSLSLFDQQFILPARSQFLMVLV